MTKDQALVNIAALYRTFNAADSDSPEDWTKPLMAATCCQPLDQLISAMLTKEEREQFYANL
jgi:hypothetical protein